MIQLNFVIVALLSSAPIDSITMTFREADGPSQILYKATCIRTKTATVCSLKAVTVATDKSSLACRVNFQSLFENEPSQNPQRDTFSVTVSSGACGYSNTYVMSPTGMVQTKTAPTQAKPGCRTFPPKTYQAAVVPEDTASSFDAVPIGSCKAMSFSLD